MSIEPIQFGRPCCWLPSQLDVGSHLRRLRFRFQSRQRGFLLNTTTTAASSHVWIRRSSQACKPVLLMLTVQQVRLASPSRWYACLIQPFHESVACPALQPCAHQVQNASMIWFAFRKPTTFHFPAWWTRIVPAVHSVMIQLASAGPATSRSKTPVELALRASLPTHHLACGPR